MNNSIQKFDPQDENLLLTEMEMLEIYGGSGSDQETQNGCDNDGNKVLANCTTTNNNNVAGCACPVYNCGSGSGSGCGSGCGCGCGSGGN